MPKAPRPSRLERLEKRRDQQTRTESRTQLIEQINSCLHSGHYSRGLDLLRGAAAEFPSDAELSELERLAHIGIKRNAEAQRLITESQELFAQQKSGEALQLLREAYELDKKNSLARAILANALVEHAHSLVETDWLGAETLVNQALALNPAHPTAKTILNVIVEQKKTSSAEDWVSQARKLQSSGDLLAALAWVAEGLAVHPQNFKLLQIQEAIQRDQHARRRQSRRRDIEELRRMEHDISGTADGAAKQALAERIQSVAAKYWTDGEILSIANDLLHRLGLVPQGNSTASPHSRDGSIILHVPRPSALKSSSASKGEIPPAQIPPTQAPKSDPPPSLVLSEEVSSRNTPANAIAGPSNILPGVVQTERATPSEPQLPSPQAAAVPTTEPSASAAKVTARISGPKQLMMPSSTRVALVFAAAIIVAAGTFFLGGKHQAPRVATTPAAAPAVSAPAFSGTTGAAPAMSAAAQSSPDLSPPALHSSFDTGGRKLTSGGRPPADSGHNVSSLLVIAGQDDASVFLDGRLQSPLTQAGQLRLPNLEPRDYSVQVSKSGFQDPPEQKIRIHKGEQARLIFNLQPQASPQPKPLLASLTIQGGSPGTTVFVDQSNAGAIQPDGTFSIATIHPGDHTVELRKERFKLRRFNEHFVAGGGISLGAADVALEAIPAELRINFTPADAKVAMLKGDLLTMVNSGVPLNLVPGTYTLTARTADMFTRLSTLDVIAGESRTLDLSLAPSGMSNWDDPGAWKHEKEAFIRKGGDFVLYGVAPVSGTFVFSVMVAKGHLLQWVLNYTDPKNYVLCQMDDNTFYRAVIRNGEKTNEIKISDKSDGRTSRMFHVRVSPTELVNQIRHGDSWTVLDRWTQSGANLSLGKFGFYIPRDEQLAVSGFAYYGDMNLR